jgi:methylated-DNA-[protein]-cysteine S-methyltransferase
MELLVEHIYHSPIGMIKISCDEHCITELVFVEPNDILTPIEEEVLPEIMHKCVDELIEYFAGKRKDFTIAVNQEGTAFQQKVWRELYEMPFGKTMSYADLAKKLGDSKCIRAAAAANGKNKIAIIVPCHRIIGTDQSLVGYAWGKARKRWLLQHEFRLAHGVQTLF